MKLDAGYWKKLRAQGSRLRAQGKDMIVDTRY